MAYYSRFKLDGHNSVSIIINRLKGEKTFFLSNCQRKKESCVKKESRTALGLIYDLTKSGPMTPVQSALQQLIYDTIHN